jgi:hypothetical protein
MLKALETKVLALLLPPLRAAHALTGRLILKTETFGRLKPPVPIGARWKHLPVPLFVQLGNGYARARPPEAYSVCELSAEPFAPKGDLADYEWYRGAMDALGSPVSEIEPPRTLSPVADSILDCRFTFERPDLFEGMREFDRTPFEIELEESN